jgi:fido (protein-threonine AMPylation protein)
MSIPTNSERAGSLHIRQKLHRVVAIHPFPNGNGRHARLMAYLLVMRLGRKRFTWGSASLLKAAEIRTRQ